MTQRKEKRLTPKQEDRAHIYSLAGHLNVNNLTSRRLVELESLGRALRSRFEGICSYPQCNEEPYLKRTEKMVERAKEVINLLNNDGRIIAHEINRDPRGAAIKLTVKLGPVQGEFYL